MFKKQPKIDIKPTANDPRIIVTGWLVIAFCAAITSIFYFQLTVTIPTHFNHKGIADGYGHKSTIWGLLGFNVLFYFTMTLLATKIKPWYFNFPVKVTERNAPEVYALGIRMLLVVNLACTLVLTCVSTIILLSAKKGYSPSIWMILVMVPLLLAPIAYYTLKMQKIQR